MFREIRRSERITEEDERRRREREGYRQIKPEKPLTVKEVNAFWDEVFGNLIAEANDALSQGK